MLHTTSSVFHHNPHWSSMEAPWSSICCVFTIYRNLFLSDTGSANIYRYSPSYRVPPFALLYFNHNLNLSPVESPQSSTELRDVRWALVEPSGAHWNPVEAAVESMELHRASTGAVWSSTSCSGSSAGLDWGCAGAPLGSSGTRLGFTRSSTWLYRLQELR